MKSIINHKIHVYIPVRLTKTFSGNNKGQLTLVTVLLCYLYFSFSCNNKKKIDDISSWKERIKEMQTDREHRWQRDRQTDRQASRQKQRDRQRIFLKFNYFTKTNKTQKPEHQHHHHHQQTSKQSKINYPTVLKFVKYIDYNNDM